MFSYFLEEILEKLKPYAIPLLKKDLVFLLATATPKVSWHLLGTFWRKNDFSG